MKLNSFFGKDIICPLSVKINLIQGYHNRFSVGISEKEKRRY